MWGPLSLLSACERPLWTHSQAAEISHQVQYPHSNWWISMVSIQNPPFHTQCWHSVKMGGLGSSWRTHFGHLKDRALGDQITLIIPPPATRGSTESLYNNHPAATVVLVVKRHAVLSPVLQFPCCKTYCYSKFELGRSWSKAGAIQRKNTRDQVWIPTNPGSQEKENFLVGMKTLTQWQERRNLDIEPMLARLI